MARRAIGLVLATALVVSCGGQEPTSRTQQGPKALRGAPVVVGPGRLVAIGGGRSLYLHCVGSGRPTVVLEAGFGGDSNNWSVVHPRLGRITRTCAYDRAGLGNSVALPGVHDASAEIADLQRLLSAAHLPPPYVLVGHSYGGLLMRLFARAHPHQTAGVVLVDAMGRNQDPRFVPLWRAQPRRVRRVLPDPRVRIADGVDLAAGSGSPRGSGRSGTRRSP